MISSDGKNAHYVKPIGTLYCVKAVYILFRNAPNISDYLWVQNSVVILCTGNQPHRLVQKNETQVLKKTGSGGLEKMKK